MKRYGLRDVYEPKGIVLEIKKSIKADGLKSNFIKGFGVIVLLAISLAFFSKPGNETNLIKESITPDPFNAVGVNETEENEISKNDITENELTNDNSNKDYNSKIENTETGFIVCDISGEVNSPGVYEIKENSRLRDLIQLAGGLTDGANIDAINRARVVFDGEKIYIPSIEEKGISYDNSTYSNVGISNDYSNNKININTADSDELQTINGIGPSMAEKIITYREENGPYLSIEDLMNVSGIGEKTFKKMEGQVTV